MARDDLQELNMTCKVCGKKYYACIKCIILQGRGVYTWKLDCCSHDCFRIYLIARDYQDKRVSKETAREQLIAEGVDIAYLPEGPIAHVLAEILYETVIAAEPEAMEELKVSEAVEIAPEPRRRASKKKRCEVDE